MSLVRLAVEGRPWVVGEFRVLSSWPERLRGLLGTDADALPVMLVRCGSIHTFGMRYPIDVALVGERGEVLAARRGLGAGKTLSHPRARCALERPASTGDWMEEGERLRAFEVEMRGESEMP